MSKFRKKPIIIEAVKYVGSNTKEVANFSPEILGITGSDKLEIETLEGNLTVSVGDWIIKGINGEFYPCKPDIFEKTYDLITE